MPTNAEILDIPLLTLDGRLARGVEHRIHIIGPVLTSDESGLAAASLGSLVTSDNVSYVRVIRFESRQSVRRGWRRQWQLAATPSWQRLRRSQPK